jgi:ATP-dependent DNA ligase
VLPSNTANGCFTSHVKLSTRGNIEITTHLLDDVTQLHDGHANQAIISGKAVILDADVQFECIQQLLISDDAAVRGKETQKGIRLQIIARDQWAEQLNDVIDLQMEGFVIFG